MHVCKRGTDGRTDGIRNQKIILQIHHSVLYSSCLKWKLAHMWITIILSVNKNVIFRHLRSKLCVKFVSRSGAQ